MYVALKFTKLEVYLFILLCLSNTNIRKFLRIHNTYAGPFEMTCGPTEREKLRHLHSFVYRRLRAQISSFII